jgi:hypothetical protein
MKQNEISDYKELVKKEAKILKGAGMLLIKVIRTNDENEDIRIYNRPTDKQASIR